MVCSLNQLWLSVILFGSVRKKLSDINYCIVLLVRLQFSHWKIYCKMNNAFALFYLKSEFLSVKFRQCNVMMPTFMVVKEPGRHRLLYSLFCLHSPCISGHQTFLAYSNLILCYDAHLWFFRHLEAIGCYSRFCTHMPSTTGQWGTTYTKTSLAYSIKEFIL
jgi:hypothetical protein